MKSPTYFFALLTTFFICFTTFSQVSRPPIEQPIQIFTSGTGTVGDLVSGGQNILVYQDRSDSTPLSSTTPLIDGKTYYVSQVVNGVESLARSAVQMVDIGLSQQVMPFGSKLKDLDVSMSAHAVPRWYDSASGGDQLPNTKKLTTGTYYVENYLPEIFQTLITNLTSGTSIAVDHRGYTYFYNDTTYQIERVDQNGENLTTVYDAGTRISRLCFDNNNDLIVNVPSLGQILRMDSNGLNATVINNTVVVASDITLDLTGNIIAVTENGTTLEMIDTNGNVTVIFEDFTMQINEVEVFSNGDLFITTYQPGAVYQIINTGSTYITVPITDPFFRIDFLVEQPSGTLRGIEDSSNYPGNRFVHFDSSRNVIGYSDALDHRINHLIIDEQGNLLYNAYQEDQIVRVFTEKVSNRTAIQVTITDERPTTDFEHQIFSTGSGTVGDLQINGQGIKWYDSQTGGIEIEASLPLTDGTTYYASQTVNAVESVSRLAITANELCLADYTVTDNTALAEITVNQVAGNTVRWFNTINGGSPLNPLDLIQGGTYYIEEVVPQEINVIKQLTRTTQDIAINDSGIIIRTESVTGEIIKMDADGQNEVVIRGGIHTPKDLAIDSQGRILFTHYSGNLVQRMDINGQNFEALNSSGWYTTAQFVAVDESDNIYVATRAGEKLFRIDSEGKNLMEIGDYSITPASLDIDPYNTMLYSGSSSFGSLARYNLGNSRLETLLGEAAREIAFDTDGNIVVANRVPGKLSVLDYGGNFVDNIGLGYIASNNIAFAPDGTLYFIDSLDFKLKHLRAEITSNRIPVTFVTTPSVAAPTTEYPYQIFYDGDPISNLSVQGQDILWYDSATSSTPLAMTDILIDDQVYHASQTINGIESSKRLEISVNNIGPAAIILPEYFSFQNFGNYMTPNYTGRVYTDEIEDVGNNFNERLYSGNYFIEDLTPWPLNETITSGISIPIDIAFDNSGNLIAIDGSNNQIVRVDGSNLEVIDGTYVTPKTLDIDERGDFLISDESDAAVKTIDRYGMTFDLYQRLNNPKKLISTTDSNFVAHLDNSIYLYKADQSMTTLNGLTYPRALSVENDGNILVRDAFDNEIKRFDPDGTFLNSFSIDGLILEMAVAPDGKIYYYSLTENKIFSIDPDGLNESVVLSFSSGTGIKRMIFDSTGRLVYINSTTNQIMRYGASYRSNRLPLNVSSIAPPPPITSNSIQIFDSAGIALEDLEITGSEISWYDSNLSTTPFMPSTTVVDGTTYYASQTLNGVESKLRAAITVMEVTDPVITLNSRTLLSDVVFTQPVDTEIKWYAEEDSDASIPDGEMLSSGNYYLELTQDPTFNVHSPTLPSTGISFNTYGGLHATSIGGFPFIVVVNSDFSRDDLINIANFQFESSDLVLLDDGEHFLAVDDVTGSVLKFPAQSYIDAAPEVIASGLSNPQGITVDPSDTIYVADTGNNRIIKMDSNGQNIVILGTGFNAPQGIAIDMDSKVWVADTGNNTIKRMETDGQNLINIMDNVINPKSIAADNNRRIVISTENNTVLTRINYEGSDVENILRGFSNIEAIAVNNQGDIAVADSGLQLLVMAESPISNRIPVQVQVLPTDYTYGPNPANNNVIEWTPNTPNDPTNPITRDDNMYVQESIVLPLDNYELRDLIMIDPLGSTVDLSYESGSFVNVHGTLDTGSGVLDMRNATLIFTGQRENSTISTSKNIIANDVILNNAQIFVPNHSDFSFKIFGSLSASTTGCIMDAGNQGSKNLIFKEDTSSNGTIDPSYNLHVDGHFTIEQLLDAKVVSNHISSPLEQDSSIFTNWMFSGIANAGEGVYVTGNGGISNGFDIGNNNDPTLFINDTTINDWSPVSNTGLIPMAGDVFDLIVIGDRTNSIDQTLTNPSQTLLTHTGTQLDTDFIIDVTEMPAPYDNTGVPESFIIGNPYPYDLDLVNAFSRTEFSAVIPNKYVVWDPKMNTAGGYRTFSNVDGNPLLSGNITDGDFLPGVLKMGQAIFVERSSAQSNGLTIARNLYGSLYPASNITPVSSIQLEIFHNADLDNGLDAVSIFFNNSMNDAIDIRDNVKWDNPDENLSRQFQTNDVLSVEQRNMPNEGDVLALSTFGYQFTDYRFKIKPVQLIGINAILNDRYTNTQTVLSNDTETEYMFSIDLNLTDSAAHDRFEILFQDISLSNNEQNLEAYFKIFPNTFVNEIHITTSYHSLINARGSIFNLSGQLLYEFNLIETETTIDLNRLSSGVYICKISTEQGSVTKKIIKE